MKRIILVILGVSFTVTLLGCETIKGVGKDLENTGVNISETIDKI